MLKVHENYNRTKKEKMTKISIKTTVQTSQTPLDLKPKRREKLRSKSSGFSIKDPDLAAGFHTNSFKTKGRRQQEKAKSNLEPEKSY